MSNYMTAEIQATCSALGYYDGQNYHLDQHCSDTIKDLIRYLRRDDESHTVRRHLGDAKLLQNDLIKILIEYADRVDLFDLVLRLIINLTSPALMVYQEQLPTEKNTRNFYLQIISHLQGYKVALADDQVWFVMSNRLSKILEIDNAERGEDNGLVIERILIFTRNVLQIPADVESEKRTDNEATIHDQVLFGLHASKMVEILLFIASNNNEQQYQMHVLEIISLMLREQSASQLASADVQRSTAEKEKDEAELLSVRQKEVQEKVEKVKKYAGSRHSRFGGTFVVKNMKAIGDNDLICHKPFHKIEAVEFSQQKVKVKRPRNKLPMRGENLERRSALSVRLFLKAFCVEFLNGAYNPVMRYARSCIMGGNPGQVDDGSYYLWALRFFMEFNRHYKFQVKFVSETISTEIFHLVQRQMEHYYEMMVTDKKKIPIWSRRLHLALKAYQELLHTLMAMDKSTDKGVRVSSKVIKSNVFYVPEYRETILSQLLCYDELKMSRNYLMDLVETVHIFTKMLEHFCEQGRTVIVQRKKKNKQRKRKNKPALKEPSPPLSLEQRWEDVSPELSVVMQNGTIPEITPFDVTLDTAVDDQKSDAMKRIQKLLRTNMFEDAIGLMRSAREVWPENESFGRSGMPAEEEFLALREIFLADLGVVEEELETDRTGNNSGREAGDFRDEEEYDEEEEEEENAAPAFEETDFKFKDFLYRFANVKVVKACSLLLQQFEKNSAEVNHCTVKLLHRIAWECKTPAMVFQASIFRSFQKIFDSNKPEHKELAKFAVFIIREFAKVAQKNPKAYMELLFWKTTRDANEIVEGYGTESENKKVSRAIWTEAEEDELRTLFMEHQTNKYPQDLVDWLLEHMINDNRTRRGVIKKLKEMYLIVNSKAVRTEVQKRLPKEWSEQEVAQLTEIWEQVKEDDDPVDLIHSGLRIKRSKPKIKEKLLELGLAEDRKQLRKKRAKKGGPGKSNAEDQSDADSDSDEDSAEENSTSAQRSRNVQNKQNKRKAKPRTKRQPTIVYTNVQLSGLLKDVIQKNMSESLEWVKESLEDALEDRDDESTEGIPLVTVTDHSAAAMDSPSFQRLLRAIGIEPPADEQESYWRVPANMLGATIRKRCDLISQALAGEFVEEETTNSAEAEPEIDDKSEDDGDVFENLKKFFPLRSFEPEDLSEPTPSTSRMPRTSGGSKNQLPKKRSESGSREQDAEEVVSTVNASDSVVVASCEEKLNTSRIRVLAESSGSENDDKMQEEDASENGRKKLHISRIRAPMDSSDSESDNGMQKENASEDGKRDRPETSDTETPVAKKRRVVDSDEEDEPIRVGDSAAPQSRRFISDDED